MPGATRRIDTPELFESMLRSLREQDYRIKEIEYCGQGEAMTHPQFNEFVQIARDLFPNTMQRLITNGNFDYGRAKLFSALDEIMVSVDGATQESYERYRVGGNLERTLNFMRDASKFIGDRRQKVIWKYILFEFNDSDEELLHAQKIAEEAQVDLLLFVFTHSLYKSQRYNLGNGHMLPIVWDRARVNATPVHYQGFRQFVPTVLEGWPAEHPGTDARFMFDDVVSDGNGGMHIHGWVLSMDAIGKVRIRHNGTVVGESPLNASRPDVIDVYPAFQHQNPGYHLSWRQEGPTVGRHVFDAEVLDCEGNRIATFSREYHVA